MKYKTHNFSSLFIIGNDVLLRKFLINIKVLKNIIYIDDFEFDTYRYDGIDFIIVKIDLHYIENIKKIGEIMKNYIEKKKYLLSNIIYFTKYTGPAENQNLRILSIYSKININLVSLKPTISFDNYSMICKELNLKTFILKDLNIDKEKFLKIIKNIYDNEYEYIYDIFINNMLNL